MSDEKEKKGFLSGLGGLFKKPDKQASAAPTPAETAKPADAAQPVGKPAPQTPPAAESKPPVSTPPSPPATAPAAKTEQPKPPESASNPSAIGSKAQKFREEFELFRSDKRVPREEKAATASTQGATPQLAPKSRKPQVAKSVDLSREFDFFTSSSGKKKADPGAGGQAPQKPAAAVIAKPPAPPVDDKPKAAAVPSPVPPPPPVSQAPAQPAVPPLKPAPSSPVVPSKVEVPPPTFKAPERPASAETGKSPVIPPPVVARSSAPQPVQPPPPPSVPQPPVPPSAKPESAFTAKISVPPLKKAEEAKTAQIPVTPAEKKESAPPPVKPLDSQTSQAPKVAPPLTPPPPPLIPPAGQQKPPEAPKAPVAEKAPEKAATPALPAVPAVADTKAQATSNPTEKTEKDSSASAKDKAAPEQLGDDAKFKSSKLTVASSGGIKKVELDPKRKRRPKVVLPPAGDAPAEPKPRRVFQLPKVIASPMLLWVLLAILLLGSGVGIYLYTRETSVVVSVQTDNLALSGEPMVVYNFTGQVSQIKRDYQQRRQPLEEQMSSIQSDLAAAKADLAGRLEKKRLMEQQIRQVQDTIPKFLEESEAKLKELWGKDSVALDKEYDDMRESLQKEVDERAKSLGLDYQRNSELNAVEVSVNAFRLSLYGASSEVNVDEQRQFGEDIVRRWKEFEKEWATKQQSIKNQAMEIKKMPGPKIDSAKQQIEDLKLELGSLEADLSILQSEVNRRQQEDVEMQDQLREVEQPFLDQLYKVPTSNILKTLSFNETGGIEMRNIQDSPEMGPGEYLLMLQARDGEGETFWAIKSFEVKKNKKTEMQVNRQDFVPARSLIE